MSHYQPTLGRRLSPREAEVMTLICEGLTQTGAAERLNLGIKTVHEHTLRAKAKLGAPTLARAAVLFSHAPGELEYRSWGAK